LKSPLTKFKNVGKAEFDNNFDMFYPKTIAN